MGGHAVCGVGEHTGCLTSVKEDVESNVCISSTPQVGENLLESFEGLSL